MIPADLLALLFFMTGSATPKASSSELRGDVPSIQPPPDRAQWEAEHGAKPWPVNTRAKDSLDTRWLARMARKAHSCIARDLQTLDRDKAIREHTKLDHICDRVRYAFDIKHAEIYFDASDGQFWIYPHGRIRHALA